MNTPVKMKLSEQLLELAEWWLSSPEDSIEFNHIADRYMLGCNLDYRKSDSNETISTACLIESEFQKDIESDSESTNTQLSVQMD